MRLPLPSRRSLFGSLVLAAFLTTGCDRSSLAAPEESLALDTFSAQITGPGGTERLAGRVELNRSTDGSAFAGAFVNYPLPLPRAEARFWFTMIGLRGERGEFLTLGHVSPSADLPVGAFGVELDRNLRPPFDFVARYARRTAEGGTIVAARDGQVQVREQDGRLFGRFRLELADGRTLSGTFAARAGAGR
jgi:hypothetical protein